MPRMRIMKLTRDSRREALEALLGRSPSGYSEYEETVRGIIDDVRARGDKAVFELEEKFDKCILSKDTLRVSPEEIEAAYKELDPESPTRQELKSSLDEVQRATRAIRNLAETLESNPNALLFGKE